MPAPFAALEDRLSAVIDRQFGEAFLFLPMTQATVNSRLQADAERQIFEFTAVIDDRNPGSTSFERLGRSSGGVSTRGGKPEFTTSNPMLFFDGSQFPNGVPRRLDRFQRVDTGAVYEITALEKDGQGRHKASLVKVAQE